MPCHFTFLLNSQNAVHFNPPPRLRGSFVNTFPLRFTDFVALCENREEAGAGEMFGGGGSSSTELQESSEDQLRGPRPKEVKDERKRRALIIAIKNYDRKNPFADLSNTIQGLTWAAVDRTAPTWMRL
eukprot:2704779-Rhodomonas_salina.1